MDHTRRGDLARTILKAFARILKRSERCGEDALKKIKSAPILAPQHESWCISSADLEGTDSLEGKFANKPLWQTLIMAEAPGIL